jgi:hypothetical protein
MLLRSAEPPLLRPHVDVDRTDRPIDRPISLSFPGGTVLTALNALVRAHGLEWELGYRDSGATAAVYALDFRGGGVMAPLLLPPSR